MRIAITTWHSGPNAGTFFQVFGLYKYLSDRGHHVEVIEYHHSNHPEDYLPRGWYYYVSQLPGLVKRKIQQRGTKKAFETNTALFKQDIEVRDRRFAEMYGKMLYTKKVNSEDDFQKLNDDFDAFIVGSDQVWNASMLNRRYLLDYVSEGKIKASYAPSMGTGQVLPYQRKMFKKYLKSYNYISTREKKLADILNKELEQNVEHVLDPSMLISKDEYLQMAHLPEQFKSGTYLLCYFMPNNEKQRKQVVDYAKKHNLKIVMMAMFANDYAFKDAEIYTAAGPCEFLGLIANAAAVFTSSFHCTIFSILFNKNLFVFQRKAPSKSGDTNQRFNEQLVTYGISRSIAWLEDWNENLEKPIDYEHVNAVFEQRLKQSTNYLNQFV
nr:polysaccharide pyruvyl transferase family protein [uncultured Prevotella sp.]